MFLIEKFEHALGGAKFIPQLFRDERKEMHIEVCQNLLNRLNEDDSYLRNFITGDEVWVYSYDTETKAPKQ